MPLNDKERRLAKVVAESFYDTRQPISHEQLLRQFDDPRPIQSLSSRNIIATSGNAPEFKYCPNVLTFFYSGEQTLQDHGKAAVASVVEDLQRLFKKTYKANLQYTFEEFATHNASRLPLPQLSLGLFLLKEIPNTIHGPQLNTQSSAVIAFCISEHILPLDSAKVWDEYLYSRIPSEDVPKSKSSNLQQPAPANTGLSAVRKEWKNLGPLGEGGQGWAFKVRRSDDPSRQVYVLKRLKNKERLERFRSEIAALSKLQHPGILKMLDTGQDSKGRPYFISEYCHGTDLSKANLSGMNLPTRLGLFRQVCDAVACAHKANILHRDLKPSNIFLREDGTAAVGDFGLCIDLNDAKERATQTSEAIGARMYIAPELETGRAPEPQAASDVYSLGKVLYYILSSKTLPREDHTDGAFDLRTAFDPDMHFVYELFDKSIKKLPEDRFRSASELLVSLDGVIERVQFRAHVLNVSVRQRCIFCGVGAYQFSPSSTNSLRGVCDRCGNIQTFIGNVGNLWWERKS